MMMPKHPKDTIHILVHDLSQTLKNLDIALASAPPTMPAEDLQRLIVASFPVLQFGRYVQFYNTLVWAHTVMIDVGSQGGESGDD